MKRISTILALLTLLLLSPVLMPKTGEAAAMRRPISPEQPMWIFHIDVWNYPDPAKVIDLIPDDLRPFVVFNISLSTNDDVTSNPDAERLIESWLRTCAAKRVWSMIQPSAGAHNRLPELSDAEYDSGESVYERLLNNYPNLIGFGFAEQFWDFGKNDLPKWSERLQTLYNILRLCNKYGAYLSMSFTQSYDNCLMMPISMIKNHAGIREQLKSNPENFICLEKYTMKKNFFDIESTCLGMFLSGCAGNHGLRFDNSGWMSNTDDYNDSSDNPFPVMAGLMPVIEHMLLTGQTVIDGPELTWQQTTKSFSVKNSGEYKTRQGGLFPHLENTYLDFFRRIINGELRILTRHEVIERTKVCVLNDIKPDASESIDGNPVKRTAYITPKTLFDGLYRQECDCGGVSYGTGWQDQRWWLKSTGRYPSIPLISSGIGDETQYLQDMGFTKIVKASAFWKDVQTKTDELNTLFPKQSEGDLFVAAQDGSANTFVVYNPYQYDDEVINSKRTFRNATRVASSAFTLKSADNDDSRSVTVSLNPYTIAVFKSVDNNALTIFLNNYSNDFLNTAKNNYAEQPQRTDHITINGFNSKPVVTWTDAANHSASYVQTSFSNGTLLIDVTHNGPLDITISQHPTTLSPHPLTASLLPPMYAGTLQVEVEDMDYKNVDAIYHQGLTSNMQDSENIAWDYNGQGYVCFIPGTSRGLRGTIFAPQAGTYRLGIRYQSPNTDTYVPLTLRVNATQMLAPSMPRTSQEWQIAYTDVTLNEGENELTLGFSSTWSTSKVYLDCVQLFPENANTIVYPLSTTSYENGPFASRQTYNLAGQRVDNSYSGIIIKNGKKIVR